MKLKIQYYKPNNRSMFFSTQETEDIVSTETVLRQKTNKQGKKNIPFMAKIHPKGFLELSLLSTQTRNSSLLPVALYLVTSLNTRDNQVVSVMVKDIVEDLCLTDKSVTKALDLLEEYTYITRKGRSEFIISPRLAYFGDAYYWSIALEYEKEGLEKTLEKINSFHEQGLKADRGHMETYAEKAGIPL